MSVGSVPETDSEEGGGDADQIVESPALRQIAQLSGLIAKASSRRQGSPERELAAQLGVSRPSLREALIALELEGLVEVGVGSGIWVTASSAERGTVKPLHEGEGPFELLRARWLFEGEIAAVAARTATERDLDGIRSALSAMERLERKNQDFSSADRDFHIHRGVDANSVWRDGAGPVGSRARRPGDRWRSNQTTAHRAAHIDDIGHSVRSRLTIRARPASCRHTSGRLRALATGAPQEAERRRAGSEPRAPDAAQAIEGRKMTTEVLRLDGVSKRFLTVVALEDVSFDLRRGEVHAVCGENGAGKSTLMNVISGQLQPDGGRMAYKGRAARFTSVREAQAAGIAMIHQELNLVPHLTVAENIYLAREPRVGCFIDRPRLRADARRVLARLHVDIDPDATLGALSVAQRQMVEIAKALSLDAEVLIMDEPTSSLTQSETELSSPSSTSSSARAWGSSTSRIGWEDAAGRRPVTVLRDGRGSRRRTSPRPPSTSWSSRWSARAGEQVPAAHLDPHRRGSLSAHGLARHGVFDDIPSRSGAARSSASRPGGRGRTEVARAISAPTGSTPARCASAARSFAYAIRATRSATASPTCPRTGRSTGSPSTWPWDRT